MSSNVIVYDGNYEVAEAVSGLTFIAPLPHTSENLVLRQDFMQHQDDFEALELNTPHPDFTDFRLVEEGDKQNLGGGVLRWTRTYAKKPESWSETGGNTIYAFIGFDGTFGGGVNVTVVSGRPRTSKVVPVRIQRDYFLVGFDGDYDTSEDIPTIAEQKYYYDTEAFAVDYLSDSPPYVTATTPSTTNYIAMIGDEIVIERSTVARWMGNIFVRETRYVVAE